MSRVIEIVDRLTLGPFRLFDVLICAATLAFIFLVRRDVSFRWGVFLAVAFALLRVPALATIPAFQGEPWLVMFVAAFTLLTFAMFLALWVFLRSIFLKKR